MRNRDNLIAEVRLNSRFTKGRIVRELRDDDLDVPTTITRFANALYAVNARFGTPPTPQTGYDVVRVPLGRGAR